jgi:hypothetical protein
MKKVSENPSQQNKPSVTPDLGDDIWEESCPRMARAKS